MKLTTEIIDRIGREWVFTADISGKCCEEEDGMHIEDLTFEFIFILLGDHIVGLVDFESLAQNFSEKEMMELKLKAEMKLIEAWVERYWDEHDIFGNGVEVL